MEAAEIYRQQGRYDRLLATLDRLQDGLGPEKTSPRVDVLQGIAMRKVGRFEEAKRCFLRAAQKDPKDESPHVELATLALERGDNAAAKEFFSEAVRLNPSLAKGPDWVQQLELEQARLATDPRRNSLPPMR